MKSILTCALVAFALALGSAAIAEPRESFDLVALNGNNAIIGTGLPGNAGNTLVTVNTTGSHTGSFYRARHLEYSFTISAWGAGTYPSQTRIRAVAPDGAAFDFQPFPTISIIAGSPAQAPVAWSGRVVLGPNTPTAGTWRFFAYESLDDAGTDARYSRLRVTFHDAAPVPSSFTDLGFLGEAVINHPITLGSAQEVRWFRLNMPALPTTSTGYADVWLSPPGASSTAADLTDTEMALFNASGLQVATNDDDGPGSHAQFSFGSTSSRGATTYPGLENGLPLAGQDGFLAAGTYYLAVGAWNMGSSSGLNAYSDYDGPQRSTMLHARVTPNPTAPAVTGAWATLVLPESGSTLVTALVEPGNYPPSTGLTVTADLSAVGGASTQPLYDDETHGDTFQGDLVYSVAASIPSNWPAGTYTVPVNVVDAQGRTASGSVPLHFATPPLGSSPVPTMTFRPRTFTPSMSVVHAPGTRERPGWSGRASGLRPPRRMTARLPCPLTWTSTPTAPGRPPPS